MPPTYLSGVDGCKAGWIMIRRDLASGAVVSDVFTSARQLLDPALACKVVAIDIPIGLSDSGSRRCDQAARKMLGAVRASSVFPAPIRPALDATTRAEADSISRAIQGKGVGAQAFAIYARVRDVDQAVRNTPGAREFVYEIHPEICFWAMNGGKAIVESKRKAPGYELRRALIEGHFGSKAVSQVREAHPQTLVADDDMLDAFAALWTAERINSGTAHVIPDPPEIDSLGLRMGIWY